MIKINKNLALFGGLFLFLGTLLAVILQKLFPFINHVSYYCQSLLNSQMNPIPYYLSIIPIFVLFLILAITIFKFLIFTAKVEYLKHTLKGKITVEKSISNLIKDLNLEEKTIVIKANEKFAYCLGIKSPKIYISTGIISRLSKKELEAVLRHEQYHLENYDTFTMIIASVVHSLFPFFPILEDLIKKYRIEREIKADKFAIQHLGESSTLISALKKVLSFPTTGNALITAMADQDTLEPRIFSLIKKDVKYPFQLRNLFITIFSSLVIFGFTVSPVQAQEIHHDEHDLLLICTNISCMNSCINNDNLDKFYSEILKNNDY
jgi:beta-lactamase regulating signal transducer with metallopeptidase domain